MDLFRMIVCVFAVLSPVATACCEEAELRRLVGRVIDEETEKPIEGVEVRVQVQDMPRGWGGEAWKDVTDKDGGYELQAIPQSMDSLVLSIGQSEKHLRFEKCYVHDLVVPQYVLEDSKSLLIRSIKLEPLRKLLVQVVDVNGKPVPNATVEFPFGTKVIGKDLPYLRNRRVTDVGGFVEFPHVAARWCPRMLVANNIAIVGGRTTGSLKITPSLIRSNSKLPEGKTLAVIVLRKPIEIRGQLQYDEDAPSKRATVQLVYIPYGPEDERFRVRLEKVEVGDDGVFKFLSTPGLTLQLWITAWNDAGKRRPRRIGVPNNGQLRQLGIIDLSKREAAK